MFGILDAAFGYLDAFFAELKSAPKKVRVQKN